MQVPSCSKDAALWEVAITTSKKGLVSHMLMDAHTWMAYMDTAVLPTDVPTVQPFTALR